MARSRSSLRNKFFKTVVLPPLIPMVLLGVVGYWQLSNLIKNSLEDQLARSAETTAARIEKEFGTRQSLLKDLGPEILRIDNEYNKDIEKRGAATVGGKLPLLESQRSGCRSAIKKTFGSFDANLSFGFIGNPSCDPFLAEFARIINDRSCDRSITNANKYADCQKALYLKRVEAGYKNTTSSLLNERQDKINALIDSFVNSFPESEEIVIMNAPDKPLVIASYVKTEPLLIEIKNEYLTNPPEQDEVAPIDGGGIKILASYAARAEKNTKFQSSTAKKAVSEIEENVVYKGYVIAIFDPVLLKDAHEAAPRPHGDQTKVVVEADSGLLVYPQQAENNDLLVRQSEMNSLNMRVIVGSPAALVHAPLRQAQQYTLLAILGSFAVSLFVGFAFVTSATNAIKNLMSGAVKFAEGKLDHKIFLATGDELETLAETMNTMAQEIKSAQESLVEKSKEFMHITSHELKAPMTGIIGYLSLIIDEGQGKVDKLARGFIEEAYTETKRLRDLVSELLNVAKLDAKKIELDIKPTDLRDEVSSALKLQDVGIKNKAIRVVYNRGEIPKVKADGSKVQLILSNFISNAVKYNRPGGLLEVNHAVEGDHLITSVKDSGLGMPQEEQKKIFQKFFRTSNAKVSGETGTGLGLYITKQFVELMGGRVWFDSTKGKGSVFYFSLPLAKNSKGP